ncbi:AAA family ATPase [Cutibacterium equinum]|uniref:AAA family ATPase n=1 Tax=Cutibacterium equinum TaxID=3016342 RepID=A0ABY7QXX5_9ACTN|nr:AAA family ATPase [Cutibacterium equinum]WCC79846.1 AAA family ATPase [Cutibacterium equinum]
MNNEITAKDFDRAREITRSIEAAVSSRLVGQHRLLRSLLVALISDGHILLESVPGLAKTLAASTLAKSVSASYGRVQCTPDLLPADIIGSQIYNAKTGAFSTELGPVHVNFLLLDELNRSSAKTQSAMLEAMQERQTSIGNETYPLPKPFLVMATQNPIEEEGTYVLPFAQMDRFMLKEVLTYPSPDEELTILDRVVDQVFEQPVPASGVTLDDILVLQQAVKHVTISPELKKYIIDIVGVTRDPGYFLQAEKAKYLELGASPRAAIAFLNAARASALLDGRDHVLPEDIVDFRYSVLRHRLILTFEATAEQVKHEDLIDAIFDVIPTP